MNDELIIAIKEVCELHEGEITPETDFWLTGADLQEIVQICLSLRGNPYM